MRPWGKLYSQMAAIEAIGVCRQGPHLSARAQRILNYLRRREARKCGAP